MILNLKSITNLSSFYVIYNSTIKNEYKGIRGISHFIEHLSCKSFDDMLDDFDKYGIYWNAYTTNSNIIYFISGIDQYVNKYKYIFLDKLLNINIIKNIEIERNIIIEEYTNIFNKQNNSHYLNLYRKLFNNYNSIGDLDDIKNITYNDCVNYQNKFYKYPSKIINVSKHYNFESNVKFNSYNNIYDINYINNNNYKYQKSNNFKYKISIIYLSNIIKKDFAYIKIIIFILSKGLKSPFYNLIRNQKGLIYYIKCDLDMLSDNSGIIKISTETNINNVDYLNNEIKFILNNRDIFLTDDRLESIKISYKIKSEKMNINRYNNIHKYLVSDEWLIENIINTINLDKLYDIYDKYFKYDNFYYSIDKFEFNKKTDS